MLRFIFPLLMIIVCLTVPSAFCQEEKKADWSIPNFDDATTFAQITTQVSELVRKLSKEVKDIESHKMYLQTIGEAYCAAGEKMLKIAKNDGEQEKEYEFKINGFKMLIQKDQLTSPNQESKYQEELNALLEKLEKEEKYLLIVNDERFHEFERGLFKQYQEATPEKLEQLKKDIRQWVNKKHFSYQPYLPLMIVLEFAESEKLSKNNPELAVKTVQELTAFVNSAECTISDEQKKEAIKRLEGYSRRCPGADLKLYGKTLDDQDFNWDALRGKYVLVKFTASWCGPCKGEIPGMLKAYEQYHDQGLEIVSVYVWDKLDKIKHAVDEEKLPWLIISEELTEKAGQPPQGKAYSIQGVPTMLLVDKDGKIIDTSVRGLSLQTRLAELFGKK